MGLNPIIICGMPDARPVVVGKLPKPPCAWSAMLASRTASYSGVSGASCPLPQGFVWSWEPWPGSPRTMKRNHWPRHSGYLDGGSAAWALLTMFRASANAPANVMDKLRFNMMTSGFGLHPCCYGSQYRKSGGDCGSKFDPNERVGSRPDRLPDRAFGHRPSNLTKANRDVNPRKTSPFRIIL